LIAVPTTVLVVVDGADVVEVVVVGGMVEVVAVGAAVVVVVARAGELVVVVEVVLVVVLPVRVDPLLGDGRVVVVTPRELSDSVAGVVWKLINPAKPATVATATKPARFMSGALSSVRLLDSCHS
jgi:hypothetical protein